MLTIGELKFIMYINNSLYIIKMAYMNRFCEGEVAQMSNSLYNTNLIMGENKEVLEKIMSIKKDEMEFMLISEMKKLITADTIKQGFEATYQIDGESLKGLFITLDGIYKTWNQITSKYNSIISAKTNYYENIWDYLNEILDGINTDILFEIEIQQFNSYINISN